MPDEQVGDQVMAALVIPNGMRLRLTSRNFLVAQPERPPKAWPRYVRINGDLPATVTNKILKRELVAAGVSAQGCVLWARRACQELQRCGSERGRPRHIRGSG